MFLATQQIQGKQENSTNKYKKGTLINQKTKENTENKQFSRYCKFFYERNNRG